MLDADPVSAYGGIIALDGTVDLATAEALAEFFLEIVAAPAFADDALARLRRKKNLRIIRYDTRLPLRLARELRVRSALGGVLAEDDDPGAAPETWRERFKAPDLESGGGSLRAAPRGSESHRLRF